MSHGQSILHTLARGAGTSFAIKLLGQGLQFLVLIVLARMLGAEGFGAYMLIWTWANLLVIIGKLGLDTTGVRFVAQYVAEERGGALRGLLIRSDQLVLLTSVAAGLVAWPLIHALSGGSATQASLWCLPLLTPILGLSALRQASMRGLKRMGFAHTPDLLLRPLCFAILLGVTIACCSPLSASTALLLHGSAMLALLPLSTHLRNRSLPKQTLATAPVFQTREWLRVSIPLLFMSGSQYLMGQTDLVMVDALLGAEAVGPYAAASRIATLFGVVLVAINSMLAPMVAERYSKKLFDEIQRLLTLAARANLAFAVAVGIGVAFAGRWVLSLFGPEFVQADTVLGVLTVAQVASSLVGSVGILTVMTGGQTAAMKIVLCCATLNVLLNYLLVSRFGILGAAMATLIATVAWNVLLLIYLRSRVPVDPTAAAAFRSLK